MPAPHVPVVIVPTPTLTTTAMEFSFNPVATEFTMNAAPVPAAKPMTMASQVPSFVPTTSFQNTAASVISTALKLNSQEFVFQPSAFVPSAPAPEPKRVEVKPAPAPIVVVVEVPKKSELELKFDRKLEQISAKPDLLLPVVAKIRSDKVNEALLREFLTHMKATSSLDDLSLIVSLNHTIAKREVGMAKTLSEVGGNIQKGGFKKGQGRGGHGGGYQNRDKYNND